MLCHRFSTKMRRALTIDGAGAALPDAVYFIVAFSEDTYMVRGSVDSLASCRRTIAEPAQALFLSEKPQASQCHALPRSGAGR